MGRTTYVPVKRRYGSAKQAAAKAAVRRAAQVLRTAGARPLAPLSSRGFYGSGFGARRGITPELKWIDSSQIGVAIGTTWGITAFNLMATGTDVNGRIGRKICMKSFLWNAVYFNLMGNSVNAVQGVMGRTVLIYDSQPNGGVHSLED